MAEKKKNSGKTPRPAATGSGPMDVGLLEQIVRLMADNDLNTVDLRDGDRRVILKRGQQVVSVQALQGVPAVQGMPAPLSVPAPPPGGSPAAAPPPAAGGGSDESSLVPIKSPMVGTFYAAGKPGEKPFVSVGSRVVQDETDVCIIEAMKTFNVHKAEVSGTIAKVLVQDGQTVQFDQPLFLVKPD